MTSAGLTAQAVADLVGGRLLGDGTVVLRTIRALDSAGPEAISLAISPKYADHSWTLTGSSPAQFTIVAGTVAASTRGSSCAAMSSSWIGL